MNYFAGTFPWWHILINYKLCWEQDITFLRFVLKPICPGTLQTYKSILNILFSECYKQIWISIQMAIQWSGHCKDILNNLLFSGMRYWHKKRLNSRVVANVCILHSDCRWRSYQHNQMPECKTRSAVKEFNLILCQYISRISPGYYAFTTNNNYLIPPGK